ncbi:hypothetical protein K3495_g857 [Podosphaera aphanis]|nr:hypothetical protein K3495_g857 [Podosphaera aphanis]
MESSHVIDTFEKTWQTTVNYDVSFASTLESPEQVQIPLKRKKNFNIFGVNDIEKSKDLFLSQCKAALEETPKSKKLKKVKENPHLTGRARRWSRKSWKDGRKMVLTKRVKLVTKSGRVSKSEVREIPESPFFLDKTKNAQQTLLITNPGQEIQSPVAIKTKAIMCGKKNSYFPERSSFEKIEALKMSKPTTHFNTVLESNNFPQKTTLTEQAQQIYSASPEIEIKSNNEVDLSNSNPNSGEVISHDNEASYYDLTDPEDDGEGINGIGFRPTPAEADARMQKRKRQILDYRIRESREARRLRCERRSLNECTTERSKVPERARRVRFLEL